MDQENHIYIAIDLKSFDASVECVGRGLDPLSTYLVVADASRNNEDQCNVSDWLDIVAVSDWNGIQLPSKIDMFDSVLKI